MSSWVVAILVIAFLILVHELGHFIAARLVGVRVEEFSIGFPPRIISRKVGNTKYSLGAFLFGGYVRLRGQNIEDEDATKADNYAAKTPWQRFFIIAAGPIINIALAIILMPFAFKSGFHTPLYLVNSPATVDKVVLGSAAERAGFQSGDQIILINGIKVENWQQISRRLENEDAFEVTVTNSFDSGEVRQLEISAGTRLDSQFGLTPLVPPVVGALRPDWPAELAGLKTGDRIVSLDGEQMWSFSQIGVTLAQKENTPLVVEYVREINGQEKLQKATIIARFDSASDGWRLGFSAATKKIHHGWIDSIKLGWDNIIRLNSALFGFFKKLFAGDVNKQELGGPVMIVKVIGEASNQGISALIVMMAFISFQLGFFNLLPLPVLDGGHLVLLIFEMFTGKQPSPKVRTRIQVAGTIFLLGLMILVTVQDLLRL